MMALRDNSDKEVARVKSEDAMDPVHHMLTHFNLCMEEWHDGSPKRATTFRHEKRSELLTDDEKREMLQRAIRTHGFREKYFNYHVIALV